MILLNTLRKLWQILAQSVKKKSTKVLGVVKFITSHSDSEKRSYFYGEEELTYTVFPVRHKIIN